MTTDSPSGAANRFELLVSVSMDIGTFASEWAYCDRLSTYVANMVSHNRTDSLLYANLFSSALNELLETAHRAHGSAGRFDCKVLRHGGRDRIELTIPDATDQLDFYRASIDAVSGEDAAGRYRDALFAEGPLDPAVGLMELAVDYNAHLTVEEGDDAVLRLSAELTLEEAAS